MTARELDLKTMEFKAAAHAHDRMKRERDAAIASVAALREALEKIETSACRGPRCAWIARAALDKVKP